MTAPRLPDFEVRVDAAKVASARRWNRGLVGGAVVMVLLAAAAATWLASAGRGSWFTVALVALLGALCVGVVVAARARTRMLRLLTGGGGVLRADDRGIRLPGLTGIGWDDLVFVCVTDDRARTRQLGRVPVVGWAGRAAIRAGSGTILCELGVRDGEALRAATADAAAASRVTLYPRWPDGARRATVPLLLDAVYDELDTQAVVTMLFAQAETHGVPRALFAQVPPAIRWKGPYLDDVIAGGLRR
ncbi:MULTISPECIES: hypothetical protein [unclassified Microbacterium]|uniref:hypothetical protein n=1 Tax=unclassified Microbacterium TaxID=2609290 RepID=UPI0030175CD2